LRFADYRGIEVVKSPSIFRSTYRVVLRE